MLPYWPRRVSRPHYAPPGGFVGGLGANEGKRSSRPLHQDGNYEELVERGKEVAKPATHRTAPLAATVKGQFPYIPLGSQVVKYGER